jgi:DNA primase
MEVPREAGRVTGTPEADLRPLYETAEQAARYFQEQLRRHPDASRAVGYLKGRGLSGEIARRYQIGFAPPGWDNLIRACGGSPTALERLRRTGMVIDRDGGGPYDRFRDRIMFPIRDHRGRVIAFGGRVLGDAKPKYLNSPETPLFHKGRELYGLFEARQALREIPQMLVVEGYMDVAALAQFDIAYAAATLGTATTADHLERLFRVSPRVVFCFDGDRAGRDAAWKALQTALPVLRESRELRFLFLPEGEDPDTLVRKEGREAFEARIKAATPLSKFLLESLWREVDLGTIDGRARLADSARPYLEKIRSEAFRREFARRLELESGRRLQLDAPRQPLRRSAARALGRPLTPVRLAIALLLRNPGLARLDHLEDGWRELDAPGISLLRDLLELMRAEPNLTTGMVIERWRESEHRAHLERLLRLELPGDESGPEREFRDALARLERQFREQETERLLAKARRGPLDAGEKQRLRALLGTQGGAV